MSPTPTTLQMLCGKIAAGKSTLAARLGIADSTVTIAEDVWLSQLFADQMSSVADYVRCSAKLRAVMGPHVASLLNANISVVLDFPANTKETRAWMREILAATNASNQLHFLDVADNICLARLRERNAKGDHAFAATEAQFRQLSKHFVAPSPDEGFDIVRHAG